MKKRHSRQLCERCELLKTSRAKSRSPPDGMAPAKDAASGRPFNNNLYVITYYIII